MRIVAHALHDHPVDLVPAPRQRAWDGGSDILFEDPTLQAATGRGWDLLCPYRFEAVWNGGPEPSDVEISAPGFVVSEVGHGVLTFQSGYQLEVEDGHHLWIRGPSNHLKDGIQPLEQVIESDLLPAVVTVNWRFTRPNEPVRFERGEPFATLVPYPADYLADVFGLVDDASPVDLPGVSCICPTYGRPDLLEEAIESFLRQDYRGPKELIVLNDFGQQTLVFEHPDVRMANMPFRLRTLGEKLNTAVGLCSYPLIAVWPDDDIALPHRLTLSVQRLDPAFGFFKASSAFFWNDDKINGIDRNVFHGGSLWTRELFERVRGYPHLTDGVDQAIERLFGSTRLDAAEPADLAPGENYYIYRWSGTGSYHVSALQRPGEPGAAYAAAERYVLNQIAAGQLPTGRVVLRPRWRRNYAADAARYVEQLDAVTPGPQASPPDGVILDPDPLTHLPIVFGTRPRPVPEADLAGLFKDDRPRRISVVLPALNERPLLQRTFAQFRATLPALSEIIVVDNGSTDGCADFLAGPDAVPPRADPEPVDLGDDRNGVSVRLLRYDRPLGVAGARNRGLEHARGEVVVFSDAHNDTPPGWWPPVVKTLNRPGVGIVGPSFSVMGRDDLAKSTGQRIVDARLRVEWLPCRQEDPYPVPTLGGGFMALRQEVACKTGGFDPGMTSWGSEDLEICLRMWLLGYEVWAVPELEIPHFFRKQSPYQVQSVHVLHNLIRTAILHLNEERVAHVLHAFAPDRLYPRAMALCLASDVQRRRDELRARRAHDDDWFFDHPYFRDIEMDLRRVGTPRTE